MAIRLKSYLNYWQRLVLENDWFSIFYIGIKWNEDIKEIVKKGGTAEHLLELEEGKKKLILEMQEAIRSGEHDEKFSKEKIINEIQKIPNPVLDDLMKYAIENEKHLLDGKTFISDEDASCLDAFMAEICIELKMKLISIIYDGTLLLVKVSSDSKNFEIKNYSKELSQLTWNAVLVSKNIDSLSSQVDRIVEKSIFELTIENLKV